MNKWSTTTQNNDLTSPTSHEAVLNSSEATSDDALETEMRDFSVSAHSS